MHIVSHRTCGSSPPCTRHPIHACAPVCCVVVVSLHPSPFPLRSIVLLPALPDVFLRVPREVEVQTPVRLPLGDRGHFRPRDTPHRSILSVVTLNLLSEGCVFTTRHCIELCEISSVFRHEVLSNFNNIQQSCVHAKICSICLVVTAFHFVLHIAAVEDLCWPVHHNPQVLLP